MNQWEVYEVLKRPSTAGIKKLEETHPEVIKEALYRVSNRITTRKSE